MSRRQLCQDLNGVRALVAHGLVHFERIAAGSDDFWVVSSLVRVRGLDGMLVAAAGGLSAWSRTLISSALAFPLLGAVAWAAGAIGLGSAGVIAVTVLALGVAMPGLLWVTGRISRSADSRRMGAAPRAGAASECAPTSGGGSAHDSGPLGGGAAPRDGVACESLGDLGPVAAVLTEARVRLVSAALRQVGRKRWDAEHLARLARQDRVISRIAEADLLLCQAIDFLEIFDAEQAGRQPGAEDGSARERGAAERGGGARAGRPAGVEQRQPARRSIPQQTASDRRPA